MRTILITGLMPVFLFVVQAMGQSSSSFATSVVSFAKGSGSGIFQPANILGPPTGGGYLRGSTNVLSLGEGGQVVLGFSVQICNGPGADFIVYENPFLVGAALATFAELSFVEVSTDGVNFARLPNRYQGPPASPGAFGSLPLGSTSGLAGVIPVQPAGKNGWLDPCQVGGDAFDLAGLVDHPMVKSSLLDLGKIKYIRIIDIKSGQERDSLGRLIYDPGGGCDIDAVGVINHRGNQSPDAPKVEMASVNGQLRLTIADPQGLLEIDPGTLHASIDGIPVDPLTLLLAFQLIKVDQQSLVMALGGLPPGLSFTIGFSLRDRAGHFTSLRHVQM